MTTDVNTGFEAKVQVNGTEVSRVYAIASSSARSVTATAIWYLNANDYAEASVYVGSTINFFGGNVIHCNFHGYLLG
jgi:hypothetical protein